MIRKNLGSITPVLVDSMFEPHLPIGREILPSKQTGGSTTRNPRGKVTRAAKVHNKRTLADDRRCPKL